MLHKDDMMIGLRGQIYGKIQAAAYKGEIGTVIEIPAMFKQFVEFDMIMNDLINNDFTVTVGTIDDDVYRFEIYWAV
jgi:hypothetical protein